MFDEDREDQENDGRNDEPELFLQGVLVMMMLMTFMVVMMFVRLIGLVLVTMFVKVLVGAAFVVMMRAALKKTSR